MIALLAAAALFSPALHSCPGAHPNVSSGASGSIEVNRVRVARMTCGRAVRALHAGHFLLTPGGPQFRTPGFACTSPVGPMPGAFRCHRGTRRFVFRLA